MEKEIEKERQRRMEAEAEPVKETPIKRGRDRGEERERDYPGLSV